MYAFMHTRMHTHTLTHRHTHSMPVYFPFWPIYIKSCVIYMCLALNMFIWMRITVSSLPFVLLSFVTVFLAEVDVDCVCLWCVSCTVAQWFVHSCCCGQGSFSCYGWSLIVYCSYSASVTGHMFTVWLYTVVTVHLSQVTCLQSDCIL